MKRLAAASPAANDEECNIGYLALQGDHGQVSYRNIKIRLIEAKK